MVYSSTHKRLGYVVIGTKGTLYESREGVRERDRYRTVCGLIRSSTAFITLRHDTTVVNRESRIWIHFQPGLNRSGSFFSLILIVPARFTMLRSTAA